MRCGGIVVVPPIPAAGEEQAKLLFGARGDAEGVPFLHTLKHLVVGQALEGKTPKSDDFIEKNLGKERAHEESKGVTP